MIFSPVPCPAGRGKNWRLPLETSGIDLPRSLDLLFLYAFLVFVEGVVGQNDDPISFLLGFSILSQPDIEMGVEEKHTWYRSMLNTTNVS